MKAAVFLAVASVVAVVTIAIGLSLTGAPNWHFTILDVITDVGGGVVFGLLAHVSANYWISSRSFVRLAIAVVLAVVGSLLVLTIEGGAAKALIFGS